MPVYFVFCNFSVSWRTLLVSLFMLHMMYGLIGIKYSYRTLKQTGSVTSGKAGCAARASG